jgi:hypothetical protein
MLWKNSCCSFIHADISLVGISSSASQIPHLCSTRVCVTCCCATNRLVSSSAFTPPVSRDPQQLTGRGFRNRAGSLQNMSSCCKSTNYTHFLHEHVLHIFPFKVVQPRSALRAVYRSMEPKFQETTLQSCRSVSIRGTEVPGDHTTILSQYIDPWNRSSRRPHYN